MAFASVGGKASSLSSTSVFEVANGLAQVRIDSSALSNLPSQPSSSSFQLSKHNYLTLEESRSSLLLLLNKLLLSSSSSSISVQQLAEFLNQQTAAVDSLIVSGDADLLEKSMVEATAQGISALLDVYVSSLSPISDAIASLSCEALKVDVSAAYGHMVDSGDGKADKDLVAVATDIRTMLNGSKLVGKFDGKQAADIPEVHGYLRDVSRSIHSKIRVKMNSPLSKKGGNGDDLATILSPLGLALKRLGEISWGRTKLIVNDSSLGPNFADFFNKRRPNADSLLDLVISSQAAYNGNDYIMSLHELYNLSKSVTKILALELAVTIVFLNVNGHIIAGGAASEENVKGGDMKKNKEKKKKVVMAKGTGVLTLFVMEKLMLETTVLTGVKTSVILEKLADDLVSFLDPKNPGFELLLNKVKEIVDSNESRRLPKLPKGTRDFANEQMVIRDRAFTIIGDVFKRHGAMPLDTPVFEMRETLKGKYGEDSKLIYDLADQGGELCSLRYDLTVPFARYVAMNGLTSFKRYQMDKVYRRDNPSKGRYREFYQCDFDIAGQYDKMAPDSEVVYILTELLEELKIGDYEVKLNHRKLLDGMLDICGVPPEKFKTICSSIDKLDKQPFEQIRKEMVDEKGLSLEVADNIGNYVKKSGRPLELLSELKQSGSKFLENNDSLDALNDLDILFRALEKAGGCLDKIVLDLSLARGLDYYTGVIFEAVFKGTTQVGSIAAGGRYDNLIGMFGTKQVPAVGVSLGIERVFTIMEQIHKDQNETIGSSETEVLVSVLGNDLALTFELVSQCWKAKIKTEYMMHKKVQKHIQRANESKIRWMIIAGETEVSRGEVKLKDLEERGEQGEQFVPISSFVTELRQRLSATTKA
jgi:histidyl-tRNA synthetase